MAVVAYVDRRDTLNRLGRVFVVGDTAVGWLAVLDPIVVREISDEDLARLVGGTYRPDGRYPSPGLYPWTGLYPSGGDFPVPPIVVSPGSWGSGTWGSGPWGG